MVQANLRWHKEMASRSSRGGALRLPPLERDNLPEPNSKLVLSEIRWPQGQIEMRLYRGYPATLDNSRTAKDLASPLHSPRTLPTVSVDVGLRVARKGSQPLSEHKAIYSDKRKSHRGYKLGARFVVGSTVGQTRLNSNFRQQYFQSTT
jgi:hypothetical protein